MKTLIALALLAVMATTAFSKPSPGILDVVLPHIISPSVIQKEAISEGLFDSFVSNFKQVRDCMLTTPTEELMSMSVLSQSREARAENILLDGFKNVLR